MNAKPTIITDTREQVPFRFSDAVQTRRAALAVRDYSLAGFEQDVVVERKSLADFLSSITHGRERFERELRQLRGFRLAVLMIETTWPDLLIGMYGTSRVTPAAAVGSLMAFVMRYRVMPILCQDHATGAELTERILTLFARTIERDFKRLPSEACADAAQGEIEAPQGGNAGSVSAQTGGLVGAGGEGGEKKSFLIC